MRLSVISVFSIVLFCLVSASSAQTTSLDELQGAVRQAGQRADAAKEKLAITEARQIAARVELRTLISRNADTSEAEQAIRELEKKEPDLTAIKARFLEEGDRHQEKLGKLKDELSKLQGSAVDTADIDQQIAAVKDDIREFENFRARALQELRQGFYCSQCKRPASQIVKEERTSFKQHLRNVRGRPIPMSAQGIAKKQKEFDRQEDRLKKKLKSLEDKRARLIQERKDKIAKLQKSVNDEYDDYSTKRTAFEADMAQARQKHKTETNAKITALREQVEKTWEAHRADIRKKQDEVSGFYDEMSDIRDEIHRAELEEMRAGFKVDRAVIQQRWEAERRARELAREKRRLRQERQAAYLANLRALQNERVRARRAAALARDQQRRAAVRPEPVRSQPDRPVYAEPPQQPVDTPQVNNEPVEIDTRPSGAPQGNSEPVAAGASANPIVPPEVQNEVPGPASPVVVPAARDVENAPEQPWPREVSQFNETLERLSRREADLAQAERDNRQKQQELARVTRERSRDDLSERSDFFQQAGDGADEGNFFENKAGWKTNVSLPGNDTEPLELIDDLTFDQLVLREPAKNLIDRMNERLATALGSQDETSNGSSENGNLAEAFSEGFSRLRSSARDLVRAKLGSMDETVLKAALESRASSFSERLHDVQKSVRDSFKPGGILGDMFVDRVVDEGYKNFYVAPDGRRFEELSKPEQTSVVIWSELVRPGSFYDKLFGTHSRGRQLYEDFETEIGSWWEQDE